MRRCFEDHFIAAGLRVSTMAYEGRRATAGYIKINGDRLREPMQKVTDKFKEQIGLTKQEPSDT